MTDRKYFKDHLTSKKVLSVSGLYEADLIFYYYFLVTSSP